MKTKTRHYSKFFAFLLAMLLVVGMLPMTAFAAGIPAPANLRFEGNVLKWDAVDGADKYSLQLQVGNSVLIPLTANNPQYDFDDNLLPGNKYTIRVYAIKGDDSSEGSKIEKSIDGTIPKLTLTWSGYSVNWPGDSQATEYTIRVKKGGTQLSGTDGYKPVDASTTSYDLTPIVNRNGAGSYSVDVHGVKLYTGNTSSEGTSSANNLTPTSTVQLNPKWNGAVATCNTLVGATNYNFTLYKDSVPAGVTGASTSHPYCDFTSYMTVGETYYFKVKALVDGDWTAEETSANYTYTGTVAPTEYTIKVNDGKASIGADSQITKAKENDEITITANAAPEGKEFDKWKVVSGSVTLANTNAASTTFIMPGGDVEVTAIYKDNEVTPPTPSTEEYNIILDNPKWDQNGADVLYSVGSKGTASAEKATAGTVITITAPDDSSDYKFKEWRINGVGGGSVATTLADATARTTTFKMPNEIVFLTAIFEENAVTPPAPVEYAIKVNEGKASIGAGSKIDKAEENDVITITADAAPEGKEFDEWKVVSGTVSLANTKAATTTFTMPGEAVEVTATYKDMEVTPPTPTPEEHKIILDNPKWDQNGADVLYSVGSKGTASAEKATAETVITITAPDDSSDYKFKEWRINGVGGVSVATTLADATARTTTFKMPNEIVFLTAIFEENAVTPPASVEYTIKVNNGKASIGAGSEITKAKENDVITITAAAAPEGKEFDKWTVVSGSVTLENVNAESTTFTMPSETVEVTANYKDKAVTPPHVHDFTGAWEKDTEGHWHKCTANDGATDTKAAHVFDSDADADCNVCGYERTITPPAPVTYTITKGDGQTVTKGNTANFVSDASFDKFVKVQVDGADVEASNYTAVSGSTDVTFTADYMKSLSNGSHTIAIVSNDGEAKGTFTIKETSKDDPDKKDDKSNTGSDKKDDKTSNNTKTDKNTGSKTTTKSSPKTGDTSNLLLWFVLLFVSGLGVTTGVVIRKKKNTK